MGEGFAAAGKPWPPQASHLISSGGPSIVEFDLCNLPCAAPAIIMKLRWCLELAEFRHW